MKDLKNTYKIATVFTEEMKRDRGLFLLTVKELINKVSKGDIIVGIDIITLQNKEIIQVTSMSEE